MGQLCGAVAKCNVDKSEEAMNPIIYEDGQLSLSFLLVSVLVLVLVLLSGVLSVVFSLPCTTGPM